MPLSDAAQALLDTFGRIVILNLPERTDRRRATEAELRRIGLPPDHPAVEVFAAIRPAGVAGFPSIGARGAFLSHLTVMERLLAEGWDRVLILEDDVAFSPDLPSRAAALARGLAGRDWHLFYGHPGNLPSPSADDSGLVALPPDLELIQLHMLGLTRRAAEVAVPALRTMLTRPPGSPEGGPMHVDGALNWVRRQTPGLITLAAAPALAHQRASRSDVAPLRWFDRLPGMRLAVALARSLR